MQDNLVAPEGKFGGFSFEKEKGNDAGGLVEEELEVQRRRLSS